MTQFTKHDMKVGNHLYFERGELIDDALYAELNNQQFSKVKSDRLAEVSEQIRLIENITLVGQALFFGEDESVDTGLIELNAPYRQAVMSDDLPF